MLTKDRLHNRFMLMLKKALFLLTLFLVLVFSVSARAGTLQLTNIGTVATGGKMYTEWWYTNVNPRLVGQASPNAEVAVKIGDTEDKVNADGSGIWSFGPTTLDVGDHNISITSGGENYSFVLHVGSDVPANILSPTTDPTQESTDSVPVTGSNQIAYLVAISVLTSFAYLYYIKSKKLLLKSFEKSAIK